jgi:hypothetical protein
MIVRTRWLFGRAPADQQRGILIALGIALLLCLLAACGRQPVRPTVEPPVCPAALAAPCEAPPYLSPEQADGPGMVENHVGWVCGFWACAARQAALAACARKDQPPAVPPPIPPRCQPQPTP